MNSIVDRLRSGLSKTRLVLNERLARVVGTRRIVDDLLLDQ